MPSALLIILLLVDASRDVNRITHKSVVDCRIECRSKFFFVHLYQVKKTLGARRTLKSLIYVARTNLGHTVNTYEISASKLFLPEVCYAGFTIRRRLDHHMI